MADVEAQGHLERALRVVDAVQDDPTQAQARARTLLTEEGIGSEAVVVTWWALGLASRQLNELPQAQAALEQAVELAVQGGFHRREGQIRSSLSLVFLYVGQTREALEQSTRASHMLTGSDRARNEMQIGLILQRLGEMDEALARYRTALVSFRRSKDRLAEARLLANRGVLHGYRGELDAGVNDLKEATRLAQILEQSLLVAGCAHNLGFLEGRRGDIPAALTWFDRAESAYNDLGRPPGMVEVLQANRAELLLSVGLVSEARKDVRMAIESLEESGNVTDLAETRLLAAEVALASGQPNAAWRDATLSSQEFVDQGRRAWHLMAEYLVLRAKAQSGDIDTGSAQQAAVLAEQLNQLGLSTESLHSSVLAGQIALRAGGVEAARSYLRSAARARKRGSAFARARAWHAEALLRHAEGNLRGSQRAIEAGFRVIRHHRQALGAAELKSHAAVLGLDLVLLAVRSALESGSPWQVLKAVETWRSESTRVAAVHPPPDRELRQLLAELRQARADVRDAAFEGRPIDHGQIGRIESAVRAVSRRAPGSDLDSAKAPITRDYVSEWVADHRLISYFTLDGDIHAVSVDGNSITLTTLASADWAQKEVASVLFSLSRLTRGSNRSRSAAALNALQSSIGALRKSLIDPIATDNGPIVVVPTAALHRLPWPALDPERVISVTPALEAWAIANASLRRVNQLHSALLVAGPGLPGAIEEVSRISKLYANRTLRTGKRAKAELVLRDIESVSIAHIAAHGTFRHDNPSFSALEMHDGPLTVYDFEQLEASPAVMVLSACDTAVTQVVAGDELLGLSSALIGRGVSSLIAPVVPIMDDVAVDLMVKLHHRLIDGDSPALALHRAISEWNDPSPTRQALCASLVAFGS